MSVLVLVEAEIKDGALDKLRTLLSKTLRETRNQEGCEHIDAFLDTGNEAKVVLVERWKTAKQYKQYRLWRMKAGAMEAMGKLLKGAPIVRILNAL